MKRCKFCNKENKSAKSPFCSFNCYQKYRYKTIPKLRKKIISRQMEYNKKRYKKDSEYRKREMGYSRAWQKKHPKEVREISRKSAKKRYWEKKNQEKENGKR